MKNKIIFLFALLCIVPGCVGPSAHFDASTMRSNTSATYMNSSAIQASGERIAKKQEKIDRKLNRHEMVSWSGVAVFGSGLEGQDLPICSQLKNDFQTTLVNRLKKLTPANFELKNLGTGMGDSEALKTGLSMVLALVSESVSQDIVLGGRLRGQISIFGQLMFLDAQNGNQLVSSYPVAVVESDLFDTQPTESQFAELAKIGLYGAPRLADGRAVSLCDQIEDLLVKDAVAPKAVLLPIEVGRVTFASACREPAIPQGATSISDNQLAMWSDELACRFAGYLGTGSGLPVNPYLPGGNRRLDKDRLTAYATRSFSMRKGDSDLIQAQLPTPRFVLNLEITCLHATLNEKESDMFTKKVDYGISGKMAVVNADSKEVVFEVPLEWPPKNTKGLPRQLAQKYASMVEATFTADEFNGPINHANIWCKKLDRVINQLAREISFPEEDVANRFGDLRARFRLNALLNNDCPSFLFSYIP
jgi:hypothetical protein